MHDSLTRQIPSNHQSLLKQMNDIQNMNYSVSQDTDDKRSELADSYYSLEMLNKQFSSRSVESQTSNLARYKSSLSDTCIQTCLITYGHNFITSQFQVWKQKIWLWKIVIHYYLSVKRKILYCPGKQVLPIPHLNVKISQFLIC